MAVTLTVEDGTGLAAANTYCTLASADTYIDERVYRPTWEHKDDEEKERALMQATRLLDEHCRWKGTRTNTGQGLRWPRAGVNSADYDTVLSSSAIPAWLARATAFMAYHLLEKNRPAEVENQRVTGSSTGRGSQSKGLPDQKNMAVIPPEVQSIIAPFVTGRGTFLIERV